MPCIASLEQIDIADVAAIGVNAAARVAEIFVDIALLAARKVVINNDFRHRMLEQFCHDEAADKPGPANDQDFAPSSFI